MARPLGENQKGFLHALKNYGNPWYAGCGWVWGTYSESVRLAESLVKRGLVRKQMHPELRDRYFLTEEGHRV